MQAGFDQLYEEHVPPIEWYTLTSQAADAARTRLAAFLGAEEGDLTLTVSTADGIAAVIGGLSWEPGGRGAHHQRGAPRAAPGRPRPPGALRRRPEGPWRSTTTPAVHPRAHRAGPDPAHAPDLHEPRHHRDTGLLVPAPEICRLARERGVPTLWDGCHAVAQIPVNLREMGCDYYASNCYKWMLGPIGTGFLYVSDEARQSLKPLLRPHEPEGGAAQYVTSTPSYVLYAGVAATIDLIESIGGVEAIQRERARERRRP